MTPVIPTRTGRTVSPRPRLERLRHHRPRRADLRAGRPERRRQDHAATPARRTGPRTPADGGTRTAPPGRTPPSWPRSASSPRDPAVPAVHRRRSHRHRRAPEPPLGRRSCGPGCSTLNIPLDRPVGTLSGGQRAQVALALTLANGPGCCCWTSRRRAGPAGPAEFPRRPGAAVADSGLTVVLSSHLLADLERVGDHLILLAASRVQLSGDIDALLAEHRVLVGPRKDTTAIARPAPSCRPAHRPPDHPARPPERPGDRPGLGERRGRARGDGARLHRPAGQSRTPRPARA